MAFPGIKVEVSNGNLLSEAAVADAVPCIVATATQASNIGELREVYSPQDAEQNYSLQSEPFLNGLIKEYYSELGGKQRLYVYGVAETQTMADCLDITNASGISKALRLSNGQINLLAIARKPAQGYNAGAGFLDTDVQAAVAASKVMAASMQATNKPLRIFIEGRVVNSSVANTFIPKEQANGYAAVVLGGTSPNGSAAVGLALARATKYPAHIKLGNGQNGPISAQNIYIGTKKIEEVASVETLHDLGYMTFHRRVGVAGYFFGVDNMCSNDDYRILAHGRVIDKAQRVIAVAMLPLVETSVRLKPNGTIEDADASYIEAMADSYVKSKLSGQISAVRVAVDRSINIVNTSTLPIRVDILPLGYLSWLTVTVGLTASIN